jgi:soluble lytic murein transglycosylase-like protein
MLPQEIRQSPERRKNRKLLTFPAIDRLRDVNHEKEVDKLMETAAKGVAAAKLLYRWRRSSGIFSLVQWDSINHQFNQMDNPSFCEFLGYNFDLVDTFGMAFGLPHKATADRLFAELLKDQVNLPNADWKLTDELRKAGK